VADKMKALREANKDKALGIPRDFGDEEKAKKAAEMKALREANKDKAGGIPKDFKIIVEEGDVNMSAGGLIPPNKRKGNIDYRKTGLVRNKRDNKRKGMK
tara:strand:- start:468 stop:767 length:300 start_codon:yes stop_codon:yes gene_type:complete